MTASEPPANPDAVSEPDSEATATLPDSVSEPAPETTAAASDAGAQTSYDIPLPGGLAAAIAEQWEPAPRVGHPASGDRTTAGGALSPGAASAAGNRAAVSRAFTGQLIVVPAGQLAVRSNDTDYAFRAFSAFTWLTGETAEGAVLVMTPNPSGHDSHLYLREYAGAGQPGYFTNRRFGALWVGNVPSVAETATVLAIDARPITELGRDLARYAGAPASLARGVDAEVDALLPKGDGGTLLQMIDELRLVKDSWEVGQLQYACEATARGFADVVGELPGLLTGGGQRGERWLEGTFWRRARMEGNDVGYTSIVGAGQHATTLHWWRNDGDIAPGQLLLADMGIEVDSLYTADITRTLPVSGEWTPAQRQLYAAVLEAQTAAVGEVKAGADFLAAHRAAMWVLADHLHSWGILPVTADVSCSADAEAPGAGLHRRYTLHGVSHMLGIDVHDCAAARDETYRNGALAPGYVLTVEPGLYFQPNDLSVPADWRGIGIRIEDDILVTNGDPVNLSASLPREPDEVVAWMRDVQAAR